MVSHDIMCMRIPPSIPNASGTVVAKLHAPDAPLLVYSPYNLNIQLSDANQVGSRILIIPPSRLITGLYLYSKSRLENQATF